METSFHGGAVGGLRIPRPAEPPLNTGKVRQVTLFRQQLSLGCSPRVLVQYVNTSSQVYTTHWIDVLGML